jgi:hypothetical protein
VERFAVMMRDLTWSPAEKAVARRAFNLALEHEFETVIRGTKERAAKIREVQDLWKLEDWLGARRREIDQRFDYRYSVLPEVFGLLIRDGRLTEDDLQGLGPDKLDFIRRVASL